MVDLKHHRSAEPLPQPGAVPAEPRRHDLSDLRMLARSILDERAGLRQHLDQDLFADPAMDILLFLFAEGASASATPTTTCCAAAGVPRTTALRWIRTMQDRGIIAMNDHPVDGRITLLRLSASTGAAVKRWLGEVADRRNRCPLARSPE